MKMTPTAAKRIPAQLALVARAPLWGLLLADADVPAFSADLDAPELPEAAEADAEDDADEPLTSAEADGPAAAALESPDREPLT